MSSSEKPWYTPGVVAFLSNDVPRMLGLSQAACARDIIRLEQRLANEGESFLTKTLPALGLSVDLALQGNVPLVAPWFKKRGSTSLPAFLQALTRRIFKDDGWLRDFPCVTSIRLLRQICYWCKKVEKGFTDESLQKAANDLIEIDSKLPGREVVLRDRRLGIARMVIEHMFTNIVSLENYTPRHGPGAVASGASSVEKRKLNHSFDDLERVFRPIPWFYSLRDAAESPEKVTGRMHCAYGLSRIVFVEKDSSGPRTIGAEPAEYMWVQQAVKAWMYDHIENRSMARGQVNFTDQSVNRNLAKEYSDWETLDMSKASDRNSFALVKALFEHTKLWPYLQASRTPGAVLPDGRVLMYNKFAPMGSATCFPVQACVYYALACAALHHSGVPFSLTFKRVFVYGDDLIVPRGSFGIINSLFEAVGLKFNLNKCCMHGKFRESCGMDAFDGVEVTPVRMRHVYETRSRTVLSSVVEHANGLASRGYWAASVAFREAACTRYPRLVDMRIPFTSRRDLPILAWLDLELDTIRIRWKNWIPYVCGWVSKPEWLDCYDADEARYLRESLSLGGPVGRLLGGRTVRRVLAKRYVGGHKRKMIPYWPHVGEQLDDQKGH